VRGVAEDGELTSDIPPLPYQPFLAKRAGMVCRRM
jgi:hypothetical protein